MDTWNYLEYVAWGLSIVFGALLLFDWLRTDRNYSEDLLTSSREGEIEATQEKHRL